MNSPSNPKIVIITGNEKVGKSQLCSALLKRIAHSGMRITGLISKLVLKDGKPYAINAINLHSNDTVELARFKPGWDSSKPKRKWKFNNSAFSWGNNVLENAVPTDILIIDEIGYQELENHQGWNSCFPILEQGDFQTAIIVVRSELINRAVNFWKKSTIIEIKENSNYESLINQILKIILNNEN